MLHGEAIFEEGQLQFGFVERKNMSRLTGCRQLVLVRAGSSRTVAAGDPGCVLDNGGSGGSTAQGTSECGGCSRNSDRRNTAVTRARGERLANVPVS